jgi:hypothetical protein
MPEHLRSIASRLRRLVADRRRAPRYNVRLSALVSLLDAASGAQPANASGHTRDVSEDGLAIILPNIRVGERYLVGDAVTLRITLKLPDANVRLYGKPVRYERLDEDQQQDRGFLIGIRLDEISDRDRALLFDYLKTLKK